MTTFSSATIRALWLGLFAVAPLQFLQAETESIVVNLLVLNYDPIVDDDHSN